MNDSLSSSAHNPEADIPPQKSASLKFPSGTSTQDIVDFITNASRSPRLHPSIQELLTAPIAMSCAPERSEASQRIPNPVKVAARVVTSFLRPFLFADTSAFVPMQQLPFSLCSSVRPIYFPPQNSCSRKASVDFPDAPRQGSSLQRRLDGIPAPLHARNRKSAPLRKRVNIRECLRNAVSASHNCISRNPGVSISSAPPDKAKSSRAVVVCRPLLSPCARLHLLHCVPISRFAIVDFPTPKIPAAQGMPGLRNSSSSRIPLRLRAHNAHTCSNRDAFHLRSLSPTSPQASALFNTITGFARTPSIARDTVPLDAD